MRLFLIAFSLLVFVAAQDISNNEVDSNYEAVRQSYAYIRATMATPTHQSQGPYKFKHIKDRALAAIKKECDQKSPDAFDKFQMAFVEYNRCVRFIASTMDYPRTRNTSVVVKSVCSVSPQVLSCFDKFMDGMKPCYGEEGLKTVAKATRAVHEMVNHLCYEDGLRVTMFIDNGGYACVSQKKPDLVACFNSTILDNKPLDGPKHMLRDSNLVETCKKIGQLQTCMKSKLEECSTSAAAVDFVEGMMATMKNSICT